MNRIVVVTDSTSNFPPELGDGYAIPTIPLVVHWGEQAYLDGVTLDTKTFYRWLSERKDSPTTSQPSAGEFMEFFQQVAEQSQTNTILGIFVSSELSGTLASATQARAELPDLNIELVDSRSISMGLGFQVLAAKRAVQEGLDLDAILARVQRVRASMQLIFTVDTLEFLHRGGRIGGAARLLGTALNLKPVLTLESGKVEALEKVRSRRKSLQRVVEIAEKRLAGRRPAELAILQTEADEDLTYMVELVNQQLKPEKLCACVLTPVVGTHAGPGALGVAFYTED